MFGNIITRIIGSIVAIGIIVGIFFLDRNGLPRQIEWVVGIAFAAALLAFIITPYITIVPYRWISDRIRKAAASDLVAAAIGLTIGLIISALLAIPLNSLPSNWGRILPFVATLLFAYLGVTIAVLRKNDIGHLFLSIQSAVTGTRSAISFARRSVQEIAKRRKTRTRTRNASYLNLRHYHPFCSTQARL